MHTKSLRSGMKMLVAFLLSIAMVVAVMTDVLVRSSAASVIAEDGKYYTDYETLEDAQEAAAELALDVASEGDVLMKNQNNALPLNGNEYVSVFGTAQDGLASYNGYPLLDALEDEGFRVNTQLRDYYESIGTTFGTEVTEFNKGLESSYNMYNDVAIVVISRGGGEGADIETVTDEEANDATENDGWEHKDLYEDEDGTAYKHFLQMTDSEYKLFEYVKAQGFKKIVYLINSSEIFEMYNLQNDSEVDGILWIGRPGQEGTKAAAKILAGKVNPSGKTVDTWYKDFTADPTWQNFGDNSQVGSTNNYSTADGTPTAGGGSGFSGQEGYFGIDYEEDIYVGYRYYETMAAEMTNGTNWYNSAVVYPFGYGMSYTTFEYSEMSVEMDNMDNDSAMTGSLDADLFASSVEGDEADVKTATATVTVTNTGNVAGKETVQLYVTAPYTKGGVEKSFVKLVGFAKTDLLQPKASQTVEITFNIQDMASYDAEGLASEGKETGYVLEQGEYTLRAMNNAHEWANSETSETYEAATFTLDATVYQHLDDYSGNEIENLFSKENGMFYSLRDNTAGTKYQFNADAAANMTQLTRADMVDLAENGTPASFPVAPTAADMTLSEDMYRSLQYWDNFNVATPYTSEETGDTYTYADGKVEEGIADADDYPWMAEQTANAERMKTWDQTGEHGIMLSEMSGINPFGTETITFKGEEMTEAKAWDVFMNTLTWQEMMDLCGQLQKSPLDTIGMNALAGNDSAWNYGSTFCFTCNCILAATWNTELAEKQGAMIGNLALLRGGNAWWGNSANTHRSPFGGRVFEYLSEDPILAGFIGGAETRGAQSKGLVCYMKHCALNDQETNRNGRNLLTWASEQTIREIYYKSFQMCAQEGESMGEMGAFARAGRVSVNANYNILTKMFHEEWGCETLSHTTDNYNGMKRCSPPDLIIRAGTDTIDKNTFSGTWDATAKRVSIEGASDATEDNQYYFVRKAAMIFLYAHANSAMNQNGIDFSDWEGETISLQQAVAAPAATAVDSGISEVAEKVTYTVADGSAMPEGLTLNADGTITGTPVASGTYTVSVVSYADNWIESDPVEYTFNIASAFDFEDTDEGTAVVGGGYYATLSTSIVTTSNFYSVSYSIAEGALPAGIEMSVNAEGSRVTLEGTPTVAGTYPVTIRATAATRSGNGWTGYTYTYSDYDFETTITIAEGAAVGTGPAFRVEGGMIQYNSGDGTWINVIAVDELKGEDGAAGAAGVGISKIEKTKTEGLVDTYTVTMTDGTTYTFTVTNGEDGAKGDKGDTGEQGPAGPAGEAGGCGSSVAAVSTVGAVALLALAGVAFVARKRSKKE